jgi:hypothetical protein
MFVVRNRMKQPWTVNVEGQDAVYFLAKEQKTLTVEQFNAPAMKELIELGYIIVLRME